VRKRQDVCKEREESPFRAEETSNLESAVCTGVLYDRGLSNVPLGSGKASYILHMFFRANNPVSDL
jgi:hypothetical protein